MEMHKGTCHVCGEEGWIRNINLYIIGSEGLNVCESCNMAIIEIVRSMRLIGGKAFLRGFKTGKQERKYE